MSDATQNLVLVGTVLIYPRIRSIMPRLKKLVRGIKVRVVIDAHIEIGAPVQPGESQKSKRQLH